MGLTTPIERLPKTSILTIKRLKSLKIDTFFDLLSYFPTRYEDFSKEKEIHSLQEGDRVSIKGTVILSKNQYARRGFTIQNIEVEDKTGKITSTWFNQPFLVRLFTKGTVVSLSGEVKRRGKLFFGPREFEVLRDKEQPQIHTGRIVPIYSAKRGLSSRTIREKIYISQKELENENLPEILPPALVKKYALLSEQRAYEEIHFPKDKILVKKAKERLSFDELFIIQLSSYLVKEKWKEETVGHKFLVGKYKKDIDRFMKTFPFSLTHAQEKVLGDIFLDLEKKNPMNRFVQGDVGSGKTIIAALAAYISYLNGFQTLVMAPTEILAMQHFKTLTALFKNTKVTIGLQTGSKKINKDMNIIVGTHALITKHISFSKVGLVVIDEQHRFGVRQRAILKEKGVNPHLLTMTATPIPRTVALTLYGELDLSVIDEMPKGRIPIKTYLVPKTKREDAYLWILKKVKEEKTQVFVICPLIEESETETMKSVRAAKKEFEYLSHKVFKTQTLGLIHGKMKAREKEEVMNRFKEKEIDILVSTPVVEVGIDIPNATIMLIEAGERYGLSQLHQLRGRVGRGKKESHCLIFTESTEAHVIERLSYFSKHTQGAELAQYDLQRRGPGDLYGTRQHGYDNLIIASFSDFLLIEKTKNAVGEFLKEYKLKNFPALEKRIGAYQIHQIAKD